MKLYPFAIGVVVLAALTSTSALADPPILPGFPNGLIQLPTQQRMVQLTLNLSGASQAMVIVESGDSKSPFSMMCMVAPGSTTAKCSTTLPYEKIKTITASVPNGSRFDGWSGSTACSGTNRFCTPKLNPNSTYQIVNLTARFTSTPVNLGVTVSGRDGWGNTGYGQVEVSGQSSLCSVRYNEYLKTQACNYALPAGTVVTLKAKPDTKTSRFVKWSGACSGTGDCVLPVNWNSSNSVLVNAEFEATNPSPQNGDYGNWRCNITSSSSSFADVRCGCDVDGAQMWQTTIGPGINWSAANASGVAGSAVAWQAYFANFSPFGEPCVKGAGSPAPTSDYRVHILSIESDKDNQIVERGSDVRFKVKFAGNGILKSLFQVDFDHGHGDWRNTRITDKVIIGPYFYFTFHAPTEYAQYDLSRNGENSNVKLSITGGDGLTASNIIHLRNPVGGDGVWQCDAGKFYSKRTMFEVSCACSVDALNKWVSAMSTFGSTITDAMADNFWRNQTVQGQPCAHIPGNPKNIAKQVRN